MTWFHLSTSYHQPRDSKTFNPFGFLSPITIGAKILFQQTCISKIEWDQSLEDENLREQNLL